MERSITPREQEIFRLLANGLSTRQVASHLVISYHTVRTHRRNVLSKLHKRGTLAAMAHLVQHGLIE